MNEKNQTQPLNFYLERDDLQFPNFTGKAHCFYTENFTKYSGINVTKPKS